LNTPATVGVPLIVIVLFAQVAVKPAGNPVAVPTPVAPVVVNVISGFKTAFTHREGLEEAGVTVLINTVMVPVALKVPHPPVNGMV
jgi:hypothetical protein